MARRYEILLSRIRCLCPLLIFDTYLTLLTFDPYVIVSYFSETDTFFYHQNMIRDFNVTIHGTPANTLLSTHLISLFIQNQIDQCTIFILRIDVIDIDRITI